MANHFLKDFAWRTFEETGDIDAYVFLREIEEKNNFVGNYLADQGAKINILGAEGNF